VALIERRWSIVIVTMAGVALSCLLAAEYLMTAFGHVSRIDQRALFEGRPYFAKWLLFGTARWPDKPIERLIRMIFLTQAGLSLVLSVVAAFRPGGVRRWIWAPLLISTGSLFMMTVWAAPVWRAAPILQKVQFPWRLLLLQSVVLAALFGLCLHVLSCLRGRAAFGAHVVVAGGLVGVAVVSLAIGRETGNLPSVYERGGKPRSREAVLARTMEPGEYVLGRVGDLTKLFPGRQKAAVLGGAGSVTVSDWRPRGVVLEVDGRTPVTVAVRQFRYTGWRESVNGGRARAADACAPLGIVCVALPPGRHHVALELTPTWHELVGRWLSRGSLTVLAAVLIVAACRRQRPGQLRPSTVKPMDPPAPPTAPDCRRRLPC
jgi:hypothetical protein